MMLRHTYIRSKHMLANFKRKREEVGWKSYHCVCPPKFAGYNGCYLYKACYVDYIMQIAAMIIFW